MDIALNIPINSLSLGQVSVNILRELHKRNIQPFIFPIGNIDVSAYELSEDFKKWLQENLNKTLSSYKRDIPILKLWHLSGGLESYGANQNLLTFYETDSPTREEVNIIKNNKSVIVTNNYTANIFKDLGLENVHVVHLGFDTDFVAKKKRIFGTPRVNWGLLGKLEKRKNTIEVLKAWAKKYGNNLNHFLNCAVFNPFLKNEDQQAIISQALGKNYTNIKFFGFMGQNKLYNDFLNNIDIVLSMSGGEGIDVPGLTATALGKHAVVLNAHAYKDWVTSENAVLVQPSSKVEVYDGVFFHKGQPFNQGNIFSFNEDEFLTGCGYAEERFRKNPVNEAGIQLQEKFGYKQAVEKILEIIK